MSYQKKSRYALIICFITFVLISGGMTLGAEKPTEISLTSVSFFKADLVGVLQQLAAECGYNVVISPEVKGTVTLQFSNTSFEEVLEYIVQSNGLAYFREKNNFYIGKAGQLPVNKRATGYFHLDYGDPSQVAESLRKIVNGADIIADERSRAVIVSGPKDTVDYASGIVRHLDRKLKQVTIEVKVVEVSNSALRQLGADWKVSDLEMNWGTTASGAEMILDMIANGHSWSAIFRSLVDTGKARLITSPSISTIEGKEASILIGDKIPIVTKEKEDDVTTTTVTYLDVGVNLVFTPWVQTDDEVAIDLKTQVNTLGNKEGDYYTIGAREVKSKIQAKIGETVFLGGLISQDERESLQKVPWVGDLPLIGKLFQNNQKSKDDKELIITITPRWNQPVKLVGEQ